jgi:hypothetical protein
LDFGNDLEYLDAMLYIFELTNLMKWFDLTFVDYGLFYKKICGTNNYGFNYNDWLYNV